MLDEQKNKRIPRWGRVQITQAERTRTIKYLLAESSRWLLHRRRETKKINIPGCREKKNNNNEKKNEKRKEGSKAQKQASKICMPLTWTSSGPETSRQKRARNKRCCAAFYLLWFIIIPNCGGRLISCGPEIESEHLWNACLGGTWLKMRTRCTGANKKYEYIRYTKYIPGIVYLDT